MLNRINCPGMTMHIGPTPASGNAPGNTYGATMAYQNARFWLMAKLSEENCMNTALDVMEEIRDVAFDENRFFDEMRRFGG